MDERALPVREDVRAACEILGFDPLYVANEGRFVAFVPQGQAERAVEVLQHYETCREAGVAGSVSAESPGRVVLKSTHRVEPDRRHVERRAVAADLLESAR